MVGLDVIESEIQPGDAMDKDLYDLPEQESAHIPKVAHSLHRALEGLNNDHAFRQPEMF